MKKPLPTLILIGLAILLAIGVTIFQKSKVVDQNEWKKFTSKELGFSISYPREWRPSEETSNVSFAAEKSETEPFAPYVRITKNLTGPDVDATGTFAKIYEATGGSKIETTTNSPLSDVNVTKVENLQVDGAQAAKILEESKIPGPFYAQRIYVLKNNIVWVISSVAPTSEELTANSNLFTEALASFKFLTN